MGRFEKFALVEGSWTDEVSGDRWLLIEIHDSDIATITFSPAPESRRTFYLGTEPRAYFDDPSASADVDLDGVRSAFEQWVFETLGLQIDSPALRAEMAAVEDEDPRDVFVEDAVVRLLLLMDLDLPPALRSASAGDDPDPQSFIERLAQRASGWVGETAQLTADSGANPPFLSIVPRRRGAASVLVVGAQPIEIQVERSNRVIKIDLADQAAQIVDEILLAIINGRVTEIRAPGRSELCVDLAGGRVVLETGLEPGWASLLPLPGWRVWGTRSYFMGYVADTLS